MFAIAVRQRRNEVAFLELRRRHGLRHPTLFTVGSSRYAPSYRGSWGVDWGGQYPTNYLLTPAMVGFGLPYVGYSSGISNGFSGSGRH